MDDNWALWYSPARPLSFRSSTHLSVSFFSRMLAKHTLTPTPTHSLSHPLSRTTRGDRTRKHSVLCVCVCLSLSLSLSLALALSRELSSTLILFLSLTQHHYLTRDSRLEAGGACNQLLRKERRRRRNRRGDFI